MSDAVRRDAKERMSQPPKPARPTANPAKVKAVIAELQALEKRDRREFAERLADNIMEPILEETEAFRSDELVMLSLTAAKWLTDNANEVMARRRRGSAKQRQTQHYMRNVAFERRILEGIVAGIRAKRGQLPNAPNPRQRALRRLANENLAGDVPKGRIRDLIEEEKQKDVDRRTAEREQRKLERRAERDRGAR